MDGLWAGGPLPGGSGIEDCWGLGTGFDLSCLHCLYHVEIEKFEVE